MSHELVYTSAKEGLKRGSRGFCTVMCTQGMASNLAELLEALSGYRHAFSPHTPEAKHNPVNYSHVVVTVGGRRYHILSRIADAGQDYTGRSNKLAHHVALEPGELVPGGPAWALSDPNFLLRQWDGQVRLLSRGRRPRSDHPVPQPCRRWKAVTGDAGWGGMLARWFLEGKNPVTVIFPVGLDVLPLIVETLNLLPESRRWEVTFSTYFTRLPPGIGCLWRFVLDGTPEASRARRDARLLCLDLCNPLGSPPADPLVEAARKGETLHLEQPQSSTPSSSASVATSRRKDRPAFFPGGASATPPSAPAPVSGRQAVSSRASVRKQGERKQLPFWLGLACGLAGSLLLAAAAFLGLQIYTSATQVSSSNGSQVQPRPTPRFPLPLPPPSDFPGPKPPEGNPPPDRKPEPDVPDGRDPRPDAGQPHSPPAQGHPGTKGPSGGNPAKPPGQLPHSPSGPDPKQPNYPPVKTDEPQHRPKHAFLDLLRPIPVPGNPDSKLLVPLVLPSPDTSDWQQVKVFRFSGDKNLPPLKFPPRTKVRITLMGGDFDNCPLQLENNGDRWIIKKKDAISRFVAELKLDNDGILRFFWGKDSFSAGYLKLCGLRIEFGNHVVHCALGTPKGVDYLDLLQFNNPKRLQVVFPDEDESVLARLEWRFALSGKQWSLRLSDDALVKEVNRNVVLPPVGELVGWKKRVANAYVFLRSHRPQEGSEADLVIDWDAVFTGFRLSWKYVEPTSEPGRGPRIELGTRTHLYIREFAGQPEPNLQKIENWIGASIRKEDTLRRKKAKENAIGKLHKHIQSVKSVLEQLDKMRPPKGAKGDKQKAFQARKRRIRRRLEGLRKILERQIAFIEGKEKLPLHYQLFYRIKSEEGNFLICLCYSKGFPHE